MPSNMRKMDRSLKGKTRIFNNQLFSACVYNHMPLATIMPVSDGLLPSSLETKELYLEFYEQFMSMVVNF
jgi:hypothetical protein